MSPAYAGFTSTCYSNPVFLMQGFEGFRQHRLLQPRLTTKPTVSVAPQIVQVRIPPGAKTRRVSLVEAFRICYGVHRPANYLSPRWERMFPSIGFSPGMREDQKRIGIASSGEVAVLLEGEIGTGKESVARATHRYGDRGKPPFVAVNCAAIPRELLESELFGHAKAAFSGAFQLASGKFEKQMAEHCSSMRSAICRWKCRPKSSVCSRTRSSPR
jgi:transcriptional regulator of acetoin/glycerol metabolism